MSFMAWLMGKELARREAILQLLNEHSPRYGLEMVKLRPRVLKRGSIYVTLHRMEDASLIYSVEQLGGRRLYWITDKGRDEIKPGTATNERPAK